MEKDLWLNSIMKTIKENPSWASDAMLAINHGVLAFSNDAQEKVNRAEMFFNCLDEKMKAKLEKMGVKF